MRIPVGCSSRRLIKAPSSEAEETDPRRSANEMNISVRTWILLAVALVWGAALRLTWLSDMEYKADEIWMFEHSQGMDPLGRWPAAGIQSSLGIPNPGMSVWVYAVPGWFIHDPVGLAAYTAVANILAICGLAWFALSRVPAGPLAVGLGCHPALCQSGVGRRVAEDMAPEHPRPIRDDDPVRLRGQEVPRRGRQLWGLIGTLLGQIHMSGFFFQAALVAWASRRISSIGVARSRADSVPPGGHGSAARPWGRYRSSIGSCICTTSRRPDHWMS